jgi:hypothetical protein
MNVSDIDTEFLIDWHPCYIWSILQTAPRRIPFMNVACFRHSITVVRNQHTMYSTCKNVRPSSRKRRNGGSAYDLFWRSTQPERVRNWAPDTTHIGVTTPEIITNRPDPKRTYRFRGAAVTAAIWVFKKISTYFSNINFNIISPALEFTVVQRYIYKTLRQNFSLHNLINPLN